MKSQQRETMVKESSEVVPEKLAAESPKGKDGEHPYCPICNEIFDEKGLPLEHRIRIKHRHMLRMHNIDAKDYKPPMPRNEA